MENVEKNVEENVEENDEENIEENVEKNDSDMSICMKHLFRYLIHFEVPIGHAFIIDFVNFVYVFFFTYFRQFHHAPSFALLHSTPSRLNWSAYGSSLGDAVFQRRLLIEPLPETVENLAKG